MIQQIKNVDGHEKDFLKSSVSNFVNIKFKPYEWQLVDPPQRISNKDGAISSTYYVLLNKKQEPTLELPFGDDPDFSAGHVKKMGKSVAYYGQRKSEIDLFHGKMQDNVYKQLSKIYGASNVRTERPLGIGVYVDLAIKSPDGEIFFEFKTSNSVRGCIRDALAQLLEYSYYPNAERAKKIIIVSPNPINEKSQEYLQKLRNRFNIPVFYMQYDRKAGSLVQKEY